MGAGLCAACLLEEALTSPDDESLIGHDVRDDIPMVQQFGEYELLDEVGRGGMGVVYRARHRGLKRVVALKMLLAGEFADAKARARLLREARTAAALAHPGLITIYDAGECQGRVFFAMEFIPGLNLAQLTHRGPLPVPQAVKIVEQIARALHYAHQNGVIHRDLKPANVLITSEGLPKLTDFGLTKLALTSSQSHSLESAGTPNFMAPEQADPRFGITSVQTDVFGLGGLLYYLLTHQPPITGVTLAETLRNAVEAEPEPPRKLRPEIPEAIEAICLKCLEKRPEERYSTAAALADELAGFLAGKPVSAKRKRRWLRSPVFIRTTAAVVFAAVTIAALLFSLKQVPAKESGAAQKDLPKVDALPAGTLDQFDGPEISGPWVLPDRLLDARDLRLTLRDGRLFLENDSPAPSTIRRTWRGAAPADKDWTVQVDVHIGTWKGTVEREDARVSLGIEVFNQNDAGDCVQQEFSFQPNNEGFPDRFVGGQMSLDYTFTGMDGIEAGIGGLASRTMTLQIRYNARLRALTIGYDRDGEANGYRFETNSHLEIGSGAANWNMGPDGKFGLRLIAHSRGVTLPTDFCYFDNLRSDSFAAD